MLTFCLSFPTCKMVPEAIVSEGVGIVLNTGHVKSSVTVWPAPQDHCGGGAGGGRDGQFQNQGLERLLILCL